MYTNDETDKAIRTRNYYLLVWVMPVLVALAAGLTFWASYKANSRILVKGGALIMFAGIWLGMILHELQKRYWLKMPDGSFYNTRHLSGLAQPGLSEPAIWEAEYYVSTQSKITPLLIAVGAIAVGVFLYTKSEKMWVESMIFSGAGAVAALVIGIKNLLDKAPHLKLARTGIWTKKLGFVTWKKVKNTQVIKEQKGKYSVIYLAIYLHGTVYEQASQPDEKLYIALLTNYKMIEPQVEQLREQAAQVNN